MKQEASSKRYNAISMKPHRKCHRDGDDVERCFMKAERLIELGELSSARQALEGAAEAPGDQAKLDKLQDECCRPQQPRELLPPDMMTFEPEIEFQLDEKMFGKNLRSAKRGVAGGPSGMMTKHVRLCWTMHIRHIFSSVWARIWQGLRCRRLLWQRSNQAGGLPLSKDDGGVRGIVAGDVVRRLVARTIAQQLGPAVKAATAPYQYALSTRPV